MYAKQNQQSQTNLLDTYLILYKYKIFSYLPFLNELGFYELGI